MAENESLDLGSSLRLRVVLDVLRNGASCQEVASKLENALIVFLRNARKQFQEKGVTLADLIDARNSPERLRQLIRQTGGHVFARLFADAAAISGPTEKDCVAGWMDAILDKMTDPMCCRVAGSERCRTIDDAQALLGKVRDKLTLGVERIVTKFAEDPDWAPRRAGRKGQGPNDGTAGLLNVSLL